jgi:hypothetical protein
MKRRNQRHNHIPDERPVFSNVLRKPDNFDPEKPIKGIPGQFLLSMGGGCRPLAMQIEDQGFLISQEHLTQLEMAHDATITLEALGVAPMVTLQKLRDQILRQAASALQKPSGAEAIRGTKTHPRDQTFDTVGILCGYLSDTGWDKIPTQEPNIPAEEIEHWYLTTPWIQPDRRQVEEGENLQPVKISLSIYTPEKHGDQAVIDIKLTGEKTNWDWITIETYSMGLSDLSPNHLDKTIRDLARAWSAANMG